MKRSVVIMTAGLLVSWGVLANTQYDEASKYADSVKDSGINTLKGTSPSLVIPGYSANPEQSKYYGGPTATGNTALNNAGNAQMNGSEAGKTLQSVIKNRPNDKISTDAPFVSGALAVEDRAETLTQGTDTQCRGVNVNKTQITHYTCERTPAVKLICTRDASISGQYLPAQEQKTFTLTNANFTFVNDGDRVRADFTVPDTGTVLGGSFDFVLNVSTHGYTQSTTVTALGSQVTVPQYGNGSYPLSAAGVSLTAGQRQSVTFYVNQGQHHDTFTHMVLSTLQSGKATFTLHLVMRVQERKWQGVADWTERCPFDKSEQVLTETVCTQPGGDRQTIVDGQHYTVHSNCWQYTDSYLSQSADNGTCAQYMNNSACTVAEQGCQELQGGNCLRERVVFSCEKKVSGAAQLCGANLVCADGSCDPLENSRVNDFQSAVSGLAALAAAGKDIAALNGVNVSAFTGKAQHCRKAMAGFSNCCKDSGWGNNVGLASCSTEEQALGEAKNRKLTLYVGAYCAHKVLGVCTEQKEGYCQFDSKLAKIIQEQGRAGQLGVGTGSGESPDCRGLTVSELQRIKFDRINFADFYADLENGTTLPADQMLIDRVKQQIAGKMHGGGQ